MCAALTTNPTEPAVKPPPLIGKEAPASTIAGTLEMVGPLSASGVIAAKAPIDTAIARIAQGSPDAFSQLAQGVSTPSGSRLRDGGCRGRPLLI